jgi:hypothetical protein
MAKQHALIPFGAINLGVSAAAEETLAATAGGLRTAGLANGERSLQQRDRGSAEG